MSTLCDKFTLNAIGKKVTILCFKSILSNITLILQVPEVGPGGLEVSEAMLPSHIGQREEQDDIKELSFEPNPVA